MLHLNTVGAGKIELKMEEIGKIEEMEEKGEIGFPTSPIFSDFSNLSK